MRKTFYKLCHAVGFGNYSIRNGSKIYKNRGWKMKIKRFMILGAAVAMIAVGVANGGFRDTLNKGIRVCLECVGIG